MKPPYIVCELSANHLGEKARMLTLIALAKNVGADAVKFQLYDPDKLAPAGMVIESGPWAGRNARELYREAMTPREWFPDLFDYARKMGIEPFSSVFDVDGLAFLESIGCSQYKIASFEIRDTALIRAAAMTGKPLIISTGMASTRDIKVAASAAEEMSGRVPTFLKCTSAYPAPICDMNLSAMVQMGEIENCPFGLSDHTLGAMAAVVATALGATMIEKHMTLNRADGGPDAAFSAEPHEFNAMVLACREAAAAMGEVRYGPTESEAPQLQLRGRTMMKA